LDVIEKSEQLKRYLGYPNLILTNYLEFRFFRNGEKYQSIKIAEQKFGAIHSIELSFSILENEIKAFLNSPPETIKSAEKLAKIMGGKASRICKNVDHFLHSEKNTSNQELFRLYEVMKQLLVHDLQIEKFADMYAQTLVYGLFVARYYDSTPDNFSRSEARDLIPASNPFLREFFDHIAGANFDSRLKYIADELCDVFSVSDIPDIMKRKYNLFGETVDKDPIIHFYEDFLFEYDPKLKKQMGAYYTPVPIVQFIIRGVDEILKNEFFLSKGISDTSKITHTRVIQNTKTKESIPRVQILDPAVGIATFLNETIKYIFSQFQNQLGLWPSFVETELLPRLYGFELMMAPYTIAHLKLALTLKETGIDNFSQRLRVYLTNTLEEGFKASPSLFDLGLVGAVTKESEQASLIKHDTPIMIVMGNPPYSGESFNKGTFAMKTVNKYKLEPGGTVKLQERNPKWINDDYVKFIGFSQDLIDKTGEGIVAMITNHGYLDNPTFRGMRWSLANSFSKIYILDLHGNAKKKEMSPDGSPDKNVFDIQQGVSIIFAIKNKTKSKKLATVFRSDLYGSRQAKFDYLKSNTISTVKWDKINLRSPSYLFLKKNEKLQSEYEQGIKLNELFPTNNVGIVTSRDVFVIDANRETLKNRIYEFSLSEPDDQKLMAMVKQNKQFNYAKAISLGFDENNIHPISYRPFDNRFIYYADYFIERSRKDVMQHFLNHENIGLMVCRQQKSDGFHHALVHKNIIESSYVSNKTSEIGSSFPLYIYSDSNQSSLTSSKTPNLNQTLVDILLKNVEDKNKVTPENIFDYIYATLHSPNYRSKFKDFLKSDFPRILVAKDTKSFWSLVRLGEQLRKLHLLDETELGQLKSNFSITGDNIVEKVTYSNNKVYINSTQYFANIDQKVFDFYIGGYQPAQKWLKDRKGQKLEYANIVHYQQIIASISKTIEIMRKIDHAN
jgi:predicted helicase